jgi:CheY-like chemotaxis protein
VAGRQERKRAEVMEDACMEKILLVDDEPEWFEVTRTYLTRPTRLRARRYDVIWTDASSVAKAYLEQAYESESRFHLAIIDLVYILKDSHVPPAPYKAVYREGLHLLDWVRSDQRFSALPVITTASYVAEDKEPWEEIALSHGANVHFGQPLDEDLLRATVARLLKGPGGPASESRQNGNGRRAK